MNNTERKIRSLLDKLSKAVDKKNYRQFDAISDKIHIISDSAGLTEIEYSEWDELRNKIAQIEIDSMFLIKN